MMDNELAYHFDIIFERDLKNTSTFWGHLKGMKNEVVDLSSRNMLTNEKCLHIYRILR